MVKSQIMHSPSSLADQQAEQDLQSGRDFHRFRESEDDLEDRDNFDDNFDDNLDEINTDLNVDQDIEVEANNGNENQPEADGDPQQPSQLKRKRKKKRSGRRARNLLANIESGEEMIDDNSRQSDHDFHRHTPDVAMLMQFLNKQREERQETFINVSSYIPTTSKHQRKLALFDNNNPPSSALARFTLYSADSGTHVVHDLYEISTDEQFWKNLLLPAEKSKPNEPTKEKGTWWLDCASVTESEMAMLSRVFALHPLTQEDISQEEPREKIELFRHYYLVSFRSFDQDIYSPTYMEPLNMYVVVFREGLLSFHSHPTSHSANVRRRIKHLRDFISVSSDWISYALIDDITDAFGPLIQSIEYEVDSIDELVLILEEIQHSDMLKRIGTCRKKVMSLLRLMSNKADVVKGLAKRCNSAWTVAPRSDIGLYLSDIQDHLVTMTQNLNHYEVILSRSHTNYLAQISIDMTKANNQINKVLSRVTVIGTILVPMNLVTGLFGMNVKIPGYIANVDNLNWFIGIVVGIISTAALAGLIAWKTMKR